MTKPDRARVLDTAASEMRSAYVLIADPQCAQASALPHLRRAWQAVAWLSRGEVPDEAGDDLSAWLAAEHLELIPSPARAAIHASLRAALEEAKAPEPWSETETAPETTPTPGPALPPARKLVSQLRSLGRVVAALEQQQLGRSLRQQAALRWALRGTVALVGAAVFVLVALRPWQSEDIGPWRSAYYPSDKFEGKPELSREADLALDWRLEPPMDSIPADYFSARFDTCLILEQEVDAAFVLESDDGSRLLIDGELIVDNWKRGPTRFKGERKALGAGVHHLRVEYFERSTRAMLTLTASFDADQAPASIPAQMLEFPGEELDESNPCAAVR